MRKILITFLSVFVCLIGFSDGKVSNASYLETFNINSTNSRAVYGQQTTRSAYQEIEHTTSYVYTPNGTSVLVKQYLVDYSAEQVERILEDYEKKSPYKDAEFLSNPTTAYNCHSYAWYSQNTSTNRNWMPYPTEYYIDHSYEEVSVPRKGDIICYFDNKGTATESDDENLHSGIVESVNTSQVNNICGKSSLVYVTSKWGAEGLFYHRGDICPYVSTYNGGADYVKFYRPRTDDSCNLSNSMNTLSVAKTINGNGTITEKYGMYELNVRNSNYYTIYIQSQYPLNNRLYNSNMGLESMTIVSSNLNTYRYVAYLSSGIYYLRTALNNLSYSGTISVSLELHDHLYTYTQNGSNHTARCTTCNYTTTFSHVYDEHYCIHCNAYTSAHDYDRNYEWVNNTTHSVECSCGAETTQGHAVSSDAFNNGQRYATCLLCGGVAEIGLIEYTINSSEITQITSNGSFILPNGVIVLVNEDLEAYLNGTLIFYHKSDTSLIQ